MVDTLPRDKLADIKKNRTSADVELRECGRVERAFIGGVLKLENALPRNTERPQVFRGGLSIADPVLCPSGKTAPQELLEPSRLLSFGMQCAAPPHPHGLLKHRAVKQGENCAHTHFVGNDQVRSETQQMPQVSWVDVQILFVESLPILAAGKGNLPAPCADHRGFRQNDLESTPGIAIAFRASM